MAKFGLDISITPESVRELEDCVLLLKWRTGMPMDEKEVEKLERVILNFTADSQVLIKMPWGSE